MKTERAAIGGTVYILGIAIAVGMVASILAMMLIAVLMEHDMIQQAHAKYAEGAILVFSIFSEALVVGQVVRGKRLIWCIVCGCACYIGLLGVNWILNGEFSSGSGINWLVVLVAGTCIGLCGKRRYVAVARGNKTKKYGRNINLQMGKQHLPVRK